MKGTKTQKIRKREGAPPSGTSNFSPWGGIKGGVNPSLGMGMLERQPKATSKPPRPEGWWNFQELVHFHRSHVMFGNWWNCNMKPETYGSWCNFHTRPAMYGN